MAEYLKLKDSSMLYFCNSHVIGGHMFFKFSLYKHDRCVKCIEGNKNDSSEEWKISAPEVCVS